MKPLRHIPAILYNKYILAAGLFGVWMFFFDKNDVLVQRERRNELEALEKSKAYFTEEIQKERTFSEELKNNPATIEKFARETYFMKKDGEDLYLIQPAGAAEKEWGPQ